MTTDLLATPVRPATGGPALARLQAKRWWMDVAGRVDRVLGAAVADDALDRAPAVSVVGDDEEQWRRWLTQRGALLDGDRVDLAIAIDVLAPLGPSEARDILRGLHDRTVQGGRILVVERVVRDADHHVWGVEDVLWLLSSATGGAVALADVASLSRPGEPSRTTMVLELVRLATKGSN